MTPYRLVPSAASKRTRVAVALGAPQRAPGCLSGLGASVVTTGARALLVVAAPPAAPDPEVPEHEAASSAMTVAPAVIQRPRVRWSADRGSRCMPFPPASRGTCQCGRPGSS